jgi:steroid delta-isomerase-like uncharacterized protein
MKQLTLKKSLLFIALSAFLTFGCKDAPKEEVTTLSDADFNALWVKVDALWEQRDPALIHTVYANAFTRAATGGTSTSAEELTNELNAVGEAFPGMTLNLVSYNIGGNMVSVIWTVDGNFTGEIAGLKGNGKPYSVKGITVLTIEDGKVVNDDSYWDTYAVFAQTGGYAIVEVEAGTE